MLFFRQIQIPEAALSDISGEGSPDRRTGTVLPIDGRNWPVSDDTECHRITCLHPHPQRWIARKLHCGTIPARNLLIGEPALFCRSAVGTWLTYQFGPRSQSGDLPIGRNYVIFTFLKKLFLTFFLPFYASSEIQMTEQKYIYHFFLRMIENRMIEKLDKSSNFIFKDKLSR